MKIAITGEGKTDFGQKEYSYKDALQKKCREEEFRQENSEF